MQRFQHASIARAWFGAFCSAALLLGISAAHANPKNIPAGSKLVYNFNVIGYPAGQTYDGNCGDGHRIFVNREAKNAHILVTNSTSGWSIQDCNATSDHTAILATSQVGTFDIYMRILGKPGGTFNVCGDLTIDPATGDTLCLAGTIDLTRGNGQSKFTLAPSTLFDASLMDVLWTVETNTNFRIVQFRVYQRP